eukprot:6198491-Pleurochrysis_carterae.AAC.5
MVILNFADQQNTATIMVLMINNNGKRLFLADPTTPVLPIIGSSHCCFNSSCLLVLQIYYYSSFNAGTSSGSRVACVGRQKKSLQQCNGNQVAVIRMRDCATSLDLRTKRRLGTIAPVIAILKDSFSARRRSPPSRVSDETTGGFQKSSV